jgi:hypothetical protein
MLAASGGTSLLAQVTTTSTTTTSTTTTTESTTTTTAATTTSASSTTTSSTTTTTTAPAASSSSSSTPWGWIILGIVVAALVIALVILAVRQRSRRARVVGAWQADATAALQQARLARDMLQQEPAAGQAVDQGQLDAVRQRVDQAATALEGVASSAPDDDARLRAHDTAQALRGLDFAHEAERLLRTAPQAPTAQQLADADQVRRSRAADLDRAFARLEERSSIPERR